MADVAFEGTVDAALLFQQHAAKANIDIKVIRSPNDGYWSNVWMNKPFTAAYWEFDGFKIVERWWFA